MFAVPRVSIFKVRSADQRGIQVLLYTAKLLGTAIIIDAHPRSAEGSVAGVAVRSVSAVENK